MSPSELKVSRRGFLKSMTAFIAGVTMGLTADDAKSGLLPSPCIMTVNGPISSSSVGTTLPHEHVMVDFIGADKVSADRYDREEVYQTVMPFLEDVYSKGCRTLVECTPKYLGRDPLLLKRLSSDSMLNILTNTGLYGAGDDRFVPQCAVDASAEQLAESWTSEWSCGIDGTGIRPGFIKIGVDPAPSELDMKLVRAAGLTHLETGLTIASHTTTGSAAKAQIELLKSMGIHPSAFIWVHAHVEPDIELHKWAAGQGAWVEYDGLSMESLEQHVQLVKNMRRSGLIHRVMVSHDAGWYNVGEPGGGSFRPFNTLFTDFLPAIMREGFSYHAVRQITRTNPSRAFSIRVRKLD